MKSLLTIATCALLFVSCGKNPQSKIVDHVYVETKKVDEDVWLGLVTELNLGGLQMTSIELPIHDPKSPGEYYGKFRLSSDIVTLNSVVEIDLNFSKLAQVQGSFEPTLPTGEPLPFRGLENEEIIEFEVPQINSKVYIYVTRDTVLVGFASTIKEFSKAAPYLGGADLFFGFNKNQVRGSVGFFSSAETKETGLGLFADLSQVVSADALRDLILSQNTKEPEFKVKSMSKSTQKKVFKGFLKVSKDSDQLNAQ